jgi:hypothetical protein
MQDPQSSNAEDSSLLGIYAVLYSEWFLTSQRIYSFTLTDEHATILGKISGDTQ